MVIIQKIFFSVLCLSLLVSCSNSIQTKNSSNEKEQEYILTKAKNYQGLIKLYRKKLTQKENFDVRFELSNYYNLVGDYESSLYYLEPLINNKPNDKVLLLHAKNLNEVGKEQLARKAILTALELNPKNGEAFNMLGVLQAQQGEFNAAFKSFNTARDLFVPDESVVNNLSMLMILQGDYEKAYSYLMPLYLREQNVDSVIHNLIFVLIKMKKFEEAENLIQLNGLSDDPKQLVTELTTIVTHIKQTNNDANTLIGGDSVTYDEKNVESVSNTASVIEDNIQVNSIIKVSSSIDTKTPNLDNLGLSQTPKLNEHKEESMDSENNRKLQPIDPQVINKLVQPPPIISGDLLVNPEILQPLIT